LLAERSNRNEPSMQPGIATVITCLSEETSSKP
jgi:hypothetical protein